MSQHNDGSNPGVTIRELADAMGVAYQTVQRWIEPGDMPVLRWDIMSGRRFARLDMNQCIEWARVNRPRNANLA